MWLILIGVLLVIIYYEVIKPWLYWKDRGVVGLIPLPFIGNLGLFIFHLKSVFDWIIYIYHQYENERYFGMHLFGNPALCIRDLKLLKEITIQYSDQFVDHHDFLPYKVDTLVDNTLGSLNGQRWRDMRAILTSSFTRNKLKTMFTIVSDCTQEFIKYFGKQNQSMVHVEMKDAFTRLANDIIATAAFGINCNSLENRTNEFYVMGKKAVTIGPLKGLLFSVYNIFPRLSKIINIGFIPASSKKFFFRVVREILTSREHYGSTRPDMIDLMLKARKLKHVQDFQVGEIEKEIDVDREKKLELTDEDITAQVLIFFFGGFESISTIMSFLVYELAINLNIQEKLQNEIDDTLKECNGKLTYEALEKMKYMDMVISEALRKWPPGFQTDRVCSKDFTIAPSKASENKLIVEKGTVIIIPIAGIHRDSKNYPNPENFDPERFSDEKKKRIDPLAYIPFGAGPRKCIASRFALMESKTITFYLLSKFSIIPIDKTPIPLVLAKGTLNISPKEGFWLGLKRRIET